MSIRNVVLVGGGGRLGAHLHAALKDDFHVTVVARRSSATTLDPVVRVGDDYPVAELVAAFQGQDAVISTVAATAVETQKTMVDAAVAAGVRLFIPSDFGLESDRAALAVFAQKRAVRAHLQRTEDKLAWTAIFCGAFFEMCFEADLMRTDIVRGEATVLDSGDALFPMSTWRAVAQAVTGVLRHPDATKNRCIYIQSFAVSQNRLHRAIAATTGRPIAITERLDSATYIPQKEREVLQHGALVDLYHLIWALLVSGTDWSGKLDNQLCGIPDESLEVEMRRVVRGILDRT